MSLKHANLQMQNCKEGLEQCGRRLCLRINGIPVKSDETSDDALKYIKEIFDQSELDIPDTVIDQAHRIFPEYSDYKIKKECKAIIVTSTTFTLFILKQIILLKTIIMSSFVLWTLTVA